MQNCPRQLAMQSCALCLHVRCGTSDQILKKEEEKICVNNYISRNRIQTEMKLIKKELSNKIQETTLRGY